MRRDITYIQKTEENRKRHMETEGNCAREGTGIKEGRKVRQGRG